MLGCESAATALASGWKRASESRVVGEVLRQHLDRDVALEARVARAVDLAHAAGAERRQDLVRAEAVAGREAHGERRHPDVGLLGLLHVGEPAAVRRHGGALSAREVPGLARPRVHDLISRGVPTTRRAASSQRTSDAIWSPSRR